MEQLRVLAGEPLLVIDFRYHLVSLIAVFLAVALGIIIGTTALNEPILADIEGQVAELEQDKRGLEDLSQSLQAQLDTSQAFDDAVAPALVNGTLTDTSVLLVLANEEIAPETVEAVSAMIGEAGGTVAGQLTLLPAYTDPSTEAALEGYVTGGGLPSGVQLPEADDAGQLVGALLAQVLMAAPDGTEPDPAATSSVLAGLSALDVLSQDSDSVVPADYAIVLASGAFTGDDAAERSGALVDLVNALDAAGSGAVVAGDPDSAAETGLVGVIRADPTLSAAVSTVDNVTATAGRISAVLALGQESEGTSGKYGTGEDTQPVPPVPATAP
jgi:hypothetical protein